MSQIKPLDICEDDSPKSQKDPDEYANKLRGWGYVEERSLYWIRIFLLAFTAIFSVAIVAIYMFHLVAPTSWRWLDNTSLSNLKDLSITIIVGVVMSFITSYFFKKKSF